MKGDELIALAIQQVTVDYALRNLGLPRLRVLAALIDAPAEGRTYREAAQVAGVSVGTLHSHLRVIRERHPVVWDFWREKRRKQLAVRHAAAVARAEVRSRQWHRRQTFLQYRDRFGRYPWEP